jgi:beta-phosphoglucomutase
MAFGEVLRPMGIELSKEAYYRKYLGCDDHDCFQAILRDNGRQSPEAQISEMIAAKTRIIQKAFRTSIQPLEGAVELIRGASAAGVPIAVCSGALRREIILASRCIGVLELFDRIVSAEDVRHGKPDPEGYRLALAQLSEAIGRQVEPGRSLAIEDSAAGIDSAHAAGMKVLAVTNSCPAQTLQRADRIVDSLAEVTVESLAELTC